MTIPDDHPRASSLKTREKIIEGMHSKIVAEAGLIAHGRGEAYDYLLGEETPSFALIQEKVAVALLLLAEKPIISINGNVAVLCPEEMILLSKIIGAPLEVNLFYNRTEREKIVAKKLLDSGAELVLGVDAEHHTSIPELTHSRRVVDKRGIYSADVVFVPLEDGDRTTALRKMGKKVITVDLNPLSRTSLYSNITIVNNVIRAIPEMIEIAKELKEYKQAELEKIINAFDNNESLKSTLTFISERLEKLAKVELNKLKNIE
ncbi:MAG: phosphopantothenate/pantothenate synthetase [Candidatus Heimdallarchaeota archaeon]|nr:phosphopantothenate/pantothenate synthetase [Candidatus Heimdallarchaeota archaeon]MCK4770737.1 phosphopantothenate/pantothenate synthetase [Candidatus Heimdallarchaeota archaeon]